MPCAFDELGQRKCWDDYPGSYRGQRTEESIRWDFSPSGLGNNLQNDPPFWGFVALAVTVVAYVLTRAYIANTRASRRDARRDPYYGGGHYDRGGPIPSHYRDWDDE